MENQNGLPADERELFEDFKRKLNLQAAKAQIKKIEYNLSDVTYGLSAVKAACADAASLGLGGVCVAPCFVKACSGFLGEPAARKSGVIACIGYPDGGDTTEIKVKAVKRAIKDGADEVEVTAPIAHIRDGNFAYVRKEFKKLRKAAKNKSLRISAECDLLTPRDVTRLSLIAAECRVNSVKTSTQPAGSENNVLADVAAAVKDKCTIKAEGVSSVSELSAAVDMGAGVVGCRNAPAVARYILYAAK